VYYAQSPSGLETECVGSIHAEVIPLAGGKNPHYCPADAEQGSRFGKVSISFEQLMRYNPDAIVTQEKAFYDKVYQDPRWRNLKAVQNKQVFFMPQAPFRWMDRPPSYMRLLAMQWLMAQLYPEQTDIDMVEQVRGFFKQVFDTDLTETQIQRVLQGGWVDE
jgi:iron complex transport system substrate-binding protein